MLGQLCMVLSDQSLSRCGLPQTQLPHFAVPGIYVKKQRLCGSFDIPLVGGLLVCVLWLVTTSLWQWYDTIDSANASLLMSASLWFMT